MIVIAEEPRAWAADKRWSDTYLPELKRICGQYLIGAAPDREDAERNTDLIVLTLAAVRIGCRVRRHSYLKRYGREFTIRANRPSGAKSELTKIIEGWGDYFLYAFANADETHLAAWSLCDLRVFRLWFNRFMFSNDGAMPGESQPNNDGSSTFRAFRLDELPTDFVLAAGGPEAGEGAT